MSSSAPRSACTARSTAGVMIGPLLAFGLLAIAPATSTPSSSSASARRGDDQRPFVYLALQRRLDFDMRFLPLLFVGTALTYMVLAAPLGRLADRVGRGRVFVGGYGLLLLLYGCVLLPALGPAALALCLVLFGAYYAATDGVLAALGSAVVPDELRGSGLAFLTTATGITRLLDSVAFGALWTMGGLHLAVIVFGVALAVAALAAIPLVRAEKVNGVTSRRTVFAVLALACVAGAGAYVFSAGHAAAPAPRLPVTPVAPERAPVVAKAPAATAVADAKVMRAAHYQGSISPSILSFGVLINLLAMIVIGGWGTFWGPIFGTAFLILLQEKWLREGDLQQYRKLALGLMLAAIAVLAPRGLFPVIADGVRRLVKGPPLEEDWEEEEAVARAAAEAGTELDEERETRRAPIA